MGPCLRRFSARAQAPDLGSELLASRMALPWMGDHTCPLVNRLPLVRAALGTDCFPPFQDLEECEVEASDHSKQGLNVDDVGAVH